MTSKHRWVALAVLTFARIAMGVQCQSVGALSPVLVERLGIANTELGILSAESGLALVLGEPARLSSRHR